MVIKLTRRGTAVGLDRYIIARVTSCPVPLEQRTNYVYLATAPIDSEQLTGYCALLQTAEVSDDTYRQTGIPVVQVRDVEGLKAGHIVGIEPATGALRILYRPESKHNTIFSTDRCNSNCVMCSQPPKDIDDSRIDERHLRLIELIEDEPEVMGITGGEPTLLGDGLVRILTALRDRFPRTYVHMLTNGRRYSDAGFVRKIADVGHPAFTSAVPLYSDIAGIHDYVVQADGAFDETVEGLYNCADAGLAVEIRVVLHKQTYARLPQLAEYIYRNFPFVSHVALMGMEHMGYVKKNWDTLWIDPPDYMPQLEQAVRILHYRGMRVSIYNLQLCLLPRVLWSFARQSISDFKNVYIDECNRCSVKENCSGLFLSQERLHSQRILAIR